MEIEIIKRKIAALYQAAPQVHLRTKASHQRDLGAEVPARIIGVYKNIFQLEQTEGGRTVRHTYQYGDVLIGHVVIRELDYVPMTSLLNKK